MAKGPTYNFGWIVQQVEVLIDKAIDEMSQKVFTLIVDLGRFQDYDADPALRTTLIQKYVDAKWKGVDFIDEEGPEGAKIKVFKIKLSAI